MVNILGEHVDEVRARLLTGQWLPESVQSLEAQSSQASKQVIPKVHLYGKEGTAPKRKMGHINLLCEHVQAGLDWITQTNIWRNQQG
ncbi:phosphoribosylaminoimidazole carboxylase ATPase subunit [compost metagenome]